MTPEQFSQELERLFGGQTLATLRADAELEFNGTRVLKLQLDPGPPRILLVCITGEHELSKLRIPEDRAEKFGDWSQVSLVDAIGRSMAAGGFIYDLAFESINSCRALTAAVLIVSDPRRITSLAGFWRTP